MLGGAMRLPVFIALALIAACGHKAAAPSCHDRVATMAGHLAAPRSVEAIRAQASPALRTALDEAMAHPEPRGIAYATQMVTLVGTCAPAREVFEGIAAVEPTTKVDYVREKIPPAIEACACQASPEDVGGVLEAWFTDTLDVPAR
jgi:hypothetical protein